MCAACWGRESAVTTFRMPVGPAATVWAKSRRSDDGWLSLWRHLDDTAAVAGRLWDEWLPESVRRLIGEGVPGGKDDGRALTVWLAGVHDIGKATPAFAIQVDGLARRMREHGLQMRVDPDRKLAPHATAGHLLLEKWLCTVHGWDECDAQQFAVIVGGHHGVPPEYGGLVEARRRPSLLGHAADQALWQEVQCQLLDRAAGLAGVRDRLPGWRGVRLTQPVQALLTAVVIVADWIASNDELFPYEQIDTNEWDRIDAAWRCLDLPRPWRAVPVTSSPEALFRSRFDLLHDAVMRPVQRAVIEMAQSMEEPGLLLVEAPMGEGKTEAALAAAEVLAARSGAGGCFVALPTRATSDAMFERVLAWLRRVPDADPARPALSVALAHGKARLNEQFEALLRAGRSVSVDLDGDRARQELAAHQWLIGRKKSTLSSFVVGTIDQLLFSALKARHVVLRHLGLAGKVVIIDEAHAYDVYMSAYLDRALEWLGSYRVPVVILSATLPSDRRKAMVKAYDRGRSGPMDRPRRSSRRTTASGGGNDAYASLDGDVGYPVLVASSAVGNPQIRVTEPSSRAVTVSLEPLPDELAVLAQLLRVELADGGCALVIRNTVRRVQETARFLRDSLGEVPVSVAHSRFLAPDRSVNDRMLQDLFGPPSRGGTRGRPRPHRHLVVASQVAEQSLDIDFDLLITDLAPVDLILQRLGRLHRHHRANRPGRLREARCFITGVDWAATPPEPAPASVLVYDRYLLLRSLAVVLSHLEERKPLLLPLHIAPLVQEAYSDREVGPKAWADEMAAARDAFMRRQREKQRKARDFILDPPGKAGDPLIGWLRANAGDIGDDEPRGRAQVRDTPAETVEVVVVVRRADGTLITPPWLERSAGLEVPADSRPSRALAKVISSCTLALPAPLCDLSVIEELERRGDFPAWRQDPWLEGQLVLILDEDGNTELARYSLHYDRWIGLEVARHED